MKNQESVKMTCGNCKWNKRGIVYLYNYCYFTLKPCLKDDTCNFFDDDGKLMFERKEDV
jgi:ribosomal protein L36